MQGHCHLAHWDYKFSTDRRNLSYRCPEATENIFNTSSLSCFTSSFFCPPVNPLKGKIWFCEGHDRKGQLYRKGCKYENLQRFSEFYRNGYIFSLIQWGEFLVLFPTVQGTFPKANAVHRDRKGPGTQT